MRKSFSVWVGGSEVNDYYLTQDEAIKLAEKYIEDGHDDVSIEFYHNIDGGVTL